MFKIFNKIDGFAIVTGASRGLGAAMAEELAREGYDVVIDYVHDESTERAEALAVRLSEEFGVGVVTIQADVSDYEQCEAIVAAGRAAFGPKVAVLVNNAGIQSNMFFHEMDPAHYEELIGIELLGAMHLTRIVLPGMYEAGDGCIVNISSVNGLFGGEGQVDYSAAKAALVGFSRALALEAGPHGVRVNCIAPGLIDTEMVRDGCTPEQIEAFVQTVPLGRLGLPDEVARTMSYIVNDRFLTGQVISTNGGVCRY